MKVIEIFNFLQNLNWELILAALAVAISGYSFFSSKKLNNEIAKQQLQINELLLAKEKEYLNEQNKAEFRAYKTGDRNDYTLIITNQGKADAKNVCLEILINEEYKNNFWDIEQIFPMNISAGHTGKIRYTRGMQFPSKFIAKITWDDEHGKNKIKEIEIVA